ncbi:putative DMT superfamily transporter inner membrane protein [Pseudovibrio axinellae]|uniref:Putative DMT superfamily transporter inner membrane protein n=1 Tax=Pseudovibrio axinellae TaxID=989403 RepID=A0A165VUP4_9HYPH|nr:EamA family transporter [Pseudovibrio axinellae]KZL15475.1 putative DMT superfamily transporter inner membrane protein [Pseudovibrio axinellae]SEQ01684.1 probable blue pigment (indigoidine) exporter [Pseudovibrio axinellae]
MKRQFDIALTAIAPLVWGSTYYVTSEHLPAGYPITMAALRALPAGLLLLVFARQLPRGAWWGRVFVLGALNFTLFWTLLFVAAYRLPGGIAATVGAVQPLIVIFLTALILRSHIKATAITAAVMGIGGVALLVFSGIGALDPIGLAAGIGGAASMGAGTVLTRKWQPPVPLLTFTAWQLTAGGLLLVPLAVLLEPPLPPMDAQNMLGITYLALIGAALTYILWFRGISRIEPSAVSALGFLSPLSAVVIGWVALGQALTSWQIAGAGVVLAAVWLGQFSVRITLPVSQKPAIQTNN